VANDYKNILDQNHISYSADGLSEYAAQILVFNNPVFFHDLTQQQKLVLQNGFRAFFNEVQQSVSKMNEQAVVKNYNRLKTFIICQPYIDLIMSETPIANNIPSLFLQL
ncbi:MAG TPA: hypothetical protein PLD88_03640, partial [Candidatus Berkiella sp.]|nr:hypothetical protein [Candidatus Berkiella sp.]